MKWTNIYNGLGPILSFAITLFLLMKRNYDMELNIKSTFYKNVLFVLLFKYKSGHYEFEMHFLKIGYFELSSFKQII